MLIPIILLKPVMILKAEKSVMAIRNQRGINGGALVLPALHGGGDMAHQIMLLLSVADDFGGAGKYALIPAMTGIDVVLIDPMGNPLDVDAAADAPVFGSGAEADDADVASTRSSSTASRS